MRFALSIFALLLTLVTFGQAQARVKWETSIFPPDARAGEGAQIRVMGTVDDGWHIYALSQPDGVTSLSIDVTKGKEAFASVDEPVQQFPDFVTDPTLKEEVGTFKKQFLFALPVVLAKDAKDTEVTLEIKSQACDDKTCERPFTSTVTLPVKPQAGEIRAENAAAVTDLPEGIPEPEKAPEPEAEKPFLEFLALALGAGFLALLTPCVFPMIPVTVSYFAKRAETNPHQKISGPLAYCFGIISTFAIVGLGVSATTKDAYKVTSIATHPATNIMLGVLFVVLSLSLFGVYEIGIPSWLVNKASAGRTKGGLIGPIMMGLTFSLTSFTCTVGFVGGLLGASIHGQFWYAAAGLVAFGLAFASPFFFLALFPSMLKKLPKAGSWMSTTKAAMGFLELVAAMKFFQNADIAALQGWITRPVFLSIWAVIFICGAVYLLGWMVFPDQAGNPVGWLRRGFGVAFAAMGIWCIVGSSGRSMGEVNAFIPPEPYPFKAGTGPDLASRSIGNVADELTWHEDYDVALAQAKKEGKSLFVDFTGYTCINCRLMEQNMFPRARVRGEMEKMVRVRIYTDDPNLEVAKRNQKFQETLTGTYSLPVYAVVNPEGKLLRKWKDLTRNEDEYVAFLTGPG